MLRYRFGASAPFWQVVIHRPRNLPRADQCRGPEPPAWPRINRTSPIAERLKNRNPSAQLLDRRHRNAGCSSPRGTPVRKGQLLAEIDNTTVRNAYDMAQATLAQARRKTAYKRLTPMHASGSLPDIKYVEAETGLRQAKARAAIARKSLDDCRLVATADGVVGKRSLRSGTVTVPNVTSITIVKIAKVFARVAVPENEIARIRRGRPRRSGSVRSEGGSIRERSRRSACWPTSWRTATGSGSPSPTRAGTSGPAWSAREPALPGPGPRTRHPQCLPDGRRSRPQFRVSPRRRRAKGRPHLRDDRSASSGAGSRFVTGLGPR